MIINNLRVGGGTRGCKIKDNLPNNYVVIYCTKTLRITVFALLLMLTISAKVDAQYQTYGIVEDEGKLSPTHSWILYDSGTLVIQGNGSMPPFSFSRPYREILVNKLIVCDGVTEICLGAFKGCKNLIDVSLPQSLKKIDISAFENCTKLESIEFPTNLVEIHSKAFFGCKSLKTAIIPNSVKLIGKEAFANCKTLRQISLPESLTVLEPLVFRDSPAIYECLELPQFLTAVSSQTYGLSTELITGYWTQKQRKELRANRMMADGVQEEKRKKDPIDIDIPATGYSNPNRVAVIISNETYKSFEPVDFATNDGDVFAKYCEMTLGVPPEHIIRYTDATNSQMKSAIRDIMKIAPTFDGKMELLFYYAGHGTHDAKTKQAYLVPTDAMKVSEDDCFLLADLYFTLGEMPLSKGLVFMDACFSGASRSGNMLQQGRSIKEAPEEAYPSGNVVVISSTNGDQIAMPHMKSGHGLFTYYLLKNIQEKKGNITLKDLSSSLESQVNRYSLLLNSSEQNPTVSPSDEIGDEWKTWNMLQ